LSVPYSAFRQVLPTLVPITQFTLLAAALVASLYFMWDVRHSKAE
jgi:hypothetical protein